MDKKCRRDAVGSIPNLLKVIDRCKEKRIAVQAGGNCGIWPREMSKHFKWVYTFEPHHENFHCLVRNATAENIFKYQAALGCEHKTVAMNIEEVNAGAHSINEKLGSVPVLRIDDLNLPACDLIQLDIEGYEYFALKGAEETMSKFKPILMIEHKWRCRNYGLTKEGIEEYLAGFGYKPIMKLANDLILEAHV
jgi:FkbM family methyltransferase